MLALTAEATAQDCLDYRDYTHRLGRLPLLSPVEGVGVDQDKAYVRGTWEADPISMSEMVVIDIGELSAPEWVRSIALPARPRGMTLEGGILYLALDVAGLQVWDLADAASPQLVGTVDTPGAAWSVAVAGNHAFVADWAGGLQVVDVTDPQAAAVVGQLSLPGARDVALSGALALVAGTAFWIVDVSDVTAPALLTTLSLGEPLSDVAIQGEAAFLLSDSGCLRVVDFSLPAQPTVVGMLQLSGGGALTISGQFAFCGGYGVSIVDISDPTFPHLVGRAPVGVSTTDRARSLAIEDNAVVVGCESPSGFGMLDVLELRNPVMPVPLAQLEIPGRLAAAVASAGHAYLLADPAGLLVIEIGDPPAPRVVGQLTLSGAARRIAVAGDLACLSVPPGHGDPTPVLQVVNISMPDNPWPRAVLDTPGEACDVAMSAGMAYVADGSAGLQLVSLANPAQPEIVGSIPNVAFAMSVAVSENLVVLAAGDSLLVVDVANPAAPRRRGAAWAPASFSACDVAISGGRACLLAGSGLLVYDVSAPETPTLIGSLAASCAWDSPYASVAMDAGVAYHPVSGAAQASHISAAGPPVALGWLCMASGNAIALSRDHVLVLDCSGASAGMIHLDIMPRQCAVSVPTFLTSFTVEFVQACVHVRWTVSGPSFADQFQLVARHEGMCRHVPFAPDGSGYAATDTRAPRDGAGEVTYELRHRTGGSPWRTIGARTLRLEPLLASAPPLSVHPNPANPRTRVTFSLARTERVELTVYDLVGRRVVCLAAATLAAGTHDAEWDGRDGAGQDVASGSYVVRLRTERAVDACRLTLVR